MTFRVTDPDYRIIAIIGLGRNSHAMICEAMAAEIGCHTDDFEFQEEFDNHGDWTGEELIFLDGAVVGRVVHL